MSKRITKTMANAAATKLAENVYDEKIKNADESLKELVNKLYAKYVPAPVRQCAVEYKEYYSMHYDYVSFVTNECDGGRNYKSLRLGFHVPCLNSIVVTAEDWKNLDKAEKYASDLRVKKCEYVWNVTDALFNLRTEARVKEMFPEALPYLNFADTTALSLDLSKLRSVLHQ